ncbi:hypothetical protein [Hymenobacter baengnokdamensis]|uniref:hypothetical protein n=1 Tax=Hymenobacter baengnokdamensis TaxID=2615203 RepID=UPI001245AA8A|nr:hypothetical protein [Hymenobacter baengnokdamensis]
MSGSPGLIPKPNSEACARPCSAWPGGGAAGHRAGLVGRGRQQLAALRRGVAGAGRGLRAGWQALTPGQRRAAGLALLGLTALRLYYSFVIQPFDDATSYELFVREHLLVVSSVYPYPNNHVLSNLLSWVFYQVQPGFWWSMRLPVLLVSTAATVGWFLALLRRSSFGVALLAVGWFGLLSTGLYYAATGRGYWQLIGLGGIGFGSMLTLLEPVAGQPPAAGRPPGPGSC